MQNDVRNLLVTGGTGFIGSHACVRLLENGYNLALVDNLSNSDVSVLDRIREVSGADLDFHRVDLLDRSALASVFDETEPDAVMHFAALKAVGESVRQPLRYYHNNVTGTRNLLEVMANHSVTRMVFSSSATVYGDPEGVPICEEAPLQPGNPYGRTKRIAEEMLKDLQQANPSWQVICLRYFNPVGAHPSGRLGEDPTGEPENLMPYITQVAAGERERLSVFGDDYPTPDGTGVRDYIHIMDLAEGHRAALQHIGPDTDFEVYNLGTGEGYSVLDVIHTFESVTGREVPYEITGRRKGDVASCYADPGKAREELGWTAERSLADMCRDAWRWESSLRGEA